MYRRVVAAHRHGKSSFVLDGPPPITQVFRHTPGLQMSILWGTSDSPTVTSDDPAETVFKDLTFLPQQGETRFLYLRISPG